MATHELRAVSVCAEGPQIGSPALRQNERQIVRRELVNALVRFFEQPRWVLISQIVIWLFFLVLSIGKNYAIDLEGHLKKEDFELGGKIREMNGSLQLHEYPAT